MKWWILLHEGLHFLWSFRSRKYMRWRLGTVYGSWRKEPDGVMVPKTDRELLMDLWRDRKSIPNFLYWRRKMRQQKKR